MFCIVGLEEQHEAMARTVLHFSSYILEDNMTPGVKQIPASAQFAKE